MNAEIYVISGKFSDFVIEYAHSLYRLRNQPSSIWISLHLITTEL
jgi:hypothetical protein